MLASHALFVVEISMIQHSPVANDKLRNGKSNLQANQSPESKTKRNDAFEVGVGRYPVPSPKEGYTRREQVLVKADAKVVSCKS